MGNTDEYSALVRKDNIMFVSLLVTGTIIYCTVMATMKDASGLAWSHFAAAADDAMRYAFARDIAIMVFFGFSFLMIFLKKYGFSACGYTLIIGAFTIQQSLLWEALIFAADDYEGYRLSMTSWINALFCAASIMIAYGVVLGKVTPFQICFMAFFQTVLYWINCRIGFNNIGAFDMGGSMVIHAFGAYFGVGLTYMLTPAAAHGHEERASTYTSDRLCLAGTFFLWIEYPSFNAALTNGGGIARALMQTSFSLGACVLAYSMTSRFLNNHKLNIVHLQNACLAGGVAIGSIADFPVGATGACCIGMLGGVLCVFGFQYVDPWICRVLKIQDTCGVHNLHGMPGIMCGLLSAVVVAWTRDSAQMQALLLSEEATFGSTTPSTASLTADAGTLASKQIACCFVSVGLGLFGGMLCGVILNAISSPIPDEHLFSDALFWDLVAYGENNEKTRSKRSFDEVDLEASVVEAPTAK